MAEERVKLLFEVVETRSSSVPQDALECYKNYKGHWVWVPKGSYQDPFTFGTKARYEEIEPRLVDGVWYWARVYYGRDRKDIS